MTLWVSQRLTTDHNLSDFDCGNEVLNDWLKNAAMRAQDADTARTFVWTQKDSLNVVAYYSIAPTQILRSEVSGGQSGGFSVVPAYLLARLALDSSLQHQGLGTDLLIDALETIVMASDTSSGRLIIVDAIDDAAADFYRHHDFVPVKGNERRLVMKVATAWQSLRMMKMSVTPDQQTRLVSMVFEMPDGGAVPIVLSTAELRTVAYKLEEAANRLVETGVEDGEAQLNLSQVLREALGRDPFTAQ
jgi:predicted GNAT family N-acyltransferase